MRKLFLIIVIILFLPELNVLAQKNAVISFDLEEYDLGRIKEAEGIKTFKIKFYNKGTDSLKIYSAETVENWLSTQHSNTKIGPGDIGYIELTTGKKRMVDEASCYIDVASNDRNNPSVRIHILADFEPVQRFLTDDYPVQSGHLYLKPITIKSGKASEAVSDTMDIYNDWNKTMHFSFPDMPAYISCRAVPDSLMPKSKGYLIIQYMVAKRNNFGVLNDEFECITNDMENPGKKITVQAILEPDISPEHVAVAPRIRFENPNYDFDTIIGGSELQHDFKFTNEGKNILIINKVKSPNGASYCDKSELKPGESSFIRYQYWPGGKYGRINKSVTIICNDPLNPTIILSIKGYIRN
jgi:hypothetical protein